MRKKEGEGGGKRIADSTVPYDKTGIVDVVGDVSNRSQFVGVNN